MPRRNARLQAVLACALCGCGTPGSGAPGAPADGGPPSPADGGVPGQTGDDSSSSPDGSPEGGSLPGGYPAAHPAPPQVVDLGGPVITPYIVPITFAGDPFAAQIDDFTETLGATPYWSAVTSEYGVGAATSAPPVHIATAAPASIDDTQIQQWIKSGVGGILPAARTGILYAVFYPATTTVTWNGDASCAANEGYHWDLDLGGGTKVSYAVLPRCDTAVGAPGITGVDATTLVASHEYLEAATDPFPTLAPAYGALDADHTIWGVLENVELGDLCTWADGVAIKPAGFAYTVQRTWSNSSIAAGHDPCVPAPSDVAYFNSVPATADMVTISDYGQSSATRGVSIPVGQSKVIDLSLYSDAPTPGPWTLSAADAPYYGIPATTHNLTFAFDKTQGQNGDHVALTITANAYDAQIGGAPFMIVSTLGQRTSTWFGVAGK